jgi:hypothetical protein
MALYGGDDYDDDGGGALQRSFRVCDTAGNIFTRWLLGPIVMCVCRMTNSTFGCMCHITLH